MGRFNWDTSEEHDTPDAGVVPESAPVQPRTAQVPERAPVTPPRSATRATKPAAPTGPVWHVRASQVLRDAVAGLRTSMRTRHSVRPKKDTTAVSAVHQRSWAPALWILSVTYCTAELIYNLALVEMFSAPSVSLSTFEDIETLGKSLAAFGLSLFICRWWRPRIALPLFAVCFPLLFVGIGHAYERAIDALPKQAQTAGYYLGAYRNLVVNGDLMNTTLWDPQRGANTEQKIVLTNMALIPYSGVDTARTVIDWMYGSDTDMREQLQANVDTLYLGYASVMGKLEPFYAKYAIESRRWNNLKDGMFKDMYAKEFTRLSGGVAPGLSKAQFYDALRSTNPVLAQFHNAVIIEAVPKLGVAALRMGDIPPFVTKEQFDAQIFGHIQSASAQARAGADDVLKNPHAKRIIAAAYVPSISMALSLISLLLNASLLLGAPVRWVCVRVATPSVAMTVSTLFCAGIFWTFWMHPVAPLSAPVQQMLQAPTGVTGALWQRALHVQWSVMEHSNVLRQIVSAHLVARTRTESYERLNIQKVPPVNLGNLEERMELLERHQSALLESQQQLPALDRDVVIDTQRLEKDQSYFGERKPTGPNPYLKKPKE